MKEKIEAYFTDLGIEPEEAKRLRHVSSILRSC